MDPAQIEEAPLAELMTAALGDARELVKLEVELATDEMKQQVTAALRAAIALVAALAATESTSDSIASVTSRVTADVGAGIAYLSHARWSARSGRWRSRRR